MVFHNLLMNRDMITIGNERVPLDAFLGSIIMRSANQHRGSLLSCSGPRQSSGLCIGGHYTWDFLEILF